MATYKIVNDITGEIDNIIELNSTSGFDPGTGYSLVELTGSYTWTGSGIPTNTGPTYMGGFVGIFKGQLEGQIVGDGVFDNISFLTSSTTPVTEGATVWNDGDGTLDLGLKGGNVTLQVGQQEYAMAFNAQGSTLSKGDVVYISGSQGNRIAIKKANNSSELYSKDTIGFVAETINDGEEGFIITSGQFKGLDTNGLTEGAAVYLSATDGQYTTTKPSAPNHTVILGFIERAHASAGSIYVKVDNGYELDELHNISDTSTSSTYGDFLVKSGSLWINSKQLTGSYGVTGSIDITGDLVINGTTYTAASSGTSGTAGTSGTGFSSITNFGDNRILTSDGTSNSAVAETNFTFTGTSLVLTGSMDVAGSITMNTGSLNNPLLKGYYETIVSKSISSDFGGGVVNIDLKAGNVHKIKLDGAIMDFNITNNPTGLQAGSFTLILEGDGTARAVSWGTEVTWPNGAPSIVSGSGKVDIYSFLSINGGTEYVGFVLTQNQTGLV